MSCEPQRDAAGLKKYGLSTSSGYTAEVYEHGAHVTSWRDPTGSELLFVSKEAIFKPPKAIRGGVPVCWPQFSDFGPLQQHGFARNAPWALVTSGDTSPHGAFVELELVDTDDTRALWPHAFLLRLRVSLSEAGALRMDLEVKNTGAKPLSFTFALHTYFRVHDALQARVLNLSGTSYLDSLQGRTRCTEAADAVIFDKEVDRIYLAVPPRLQLLDPVPSRTFTLETRALPDAVVWNPWVAKAAAMADFGNDEYKEMVCIEAAAVQREISVAPGDMWSGGQTLSISSA